MWCLSIRKLVVILLTLNLVFTVEPCEQLFEGFGVFLGSCGHLAKSPQGMVAKVVEKLYSDLELRYYRTSIESTFSPSPNVYSIACNDSSSFTCSWIELHNELAKRNDFSLIASIWSPPHYMKNPQATILLQDFEPDYYYFIKNITALIQAQFNLTVEKVSPINEPENVFAEWEHTNMPPEQMCRMIKSFNDSLTSLCPENSYFWVSETYHRYKNPVTKVDCDSTCDIFATHAYALNVNFSDANNFKAYYDLTAYDRKFNKSIWQTEVSSTYSRSSETQMTEGLDFGTNIANFVAHTCIQRYYFWYAYTLYSSGESLIWGNDNGELTLPKKYFVYKHFTLASAGGAKKVEKCDPDPLVSCVKFGDSSLVLVNRGNVSRAVDWGLKVQIQTGTFCCTSDPSDWNCDKEEVKVDDSNGEQVPELPALSVCSCRIGVGHGAISASSRIEIKSLYFFVFLLLLNRVQLITYILATCSQTN